MRDVTRSLLSFLAAASAVSATSTLLEGGTIITFNEQSQTVETYRDTSVLITNDRIAALYPAGTNGSVPAGTERVDARGKIITPGFIDTHRHLWQSQFRTIGSNTTLLEYFFRYAPSAAASTFKPEDVSLAQTIGIWESLNAGVTSIIDHAHATFSRETVDAALDASIASGARIFFAYSFAQGNSGFAGSEFTIEEQWAHYRDLQVQRPWEGSPTTLGVAWDFWASSTREVNEAVADLTLQSNASVLSAHWVDNVWGFANRPSLVNQYGVLNSSIPNVYAHASFIDPLEARLLRQTGQYISIDAESEMHYGHDHPTSHLVQDVSSLGVDTHFTYSADMLTQARIWLQKTRLLWFRRTIEDWRIPTTNPMSVNQAFILATRNGAKALHRDDLGVVAVGAKADLAIFDTRSKPNLIGWSNAVAAVILHANVGDISDVMVDGAWRKRDGALVLDAQERGDIEARFVESAERIQAVWRDTPLPTYDPIFAFSGVETGPTEQGDVILGNATGY